jgi:CRP-like cAMP-binding protein
MEEKFWFLKNCGLFERLTPAQTERLESRSKAREFKRGQLIYLPSDQADSVLLLGTGRVKIYHITGEGKQAVLALVDPGEIFGELALFEAGQTPRDEFAEAMETSRLILIPHQEMHELMAAHPDVSLGVTKLMGLRRKRVERRLKSLLFRSNRDRLVHLLLELAEKYGKPTVEGVVLGIKLSHQDLASIIGSTRETVTVLLGELQQEGQLTIQRRRIILSKMEQLAASIDMEPPKLPHAEDLGNRILRQARAQP